MPKIGIIAVGRDCADVLDEVLAPWVESFWRHDIHIHLISATFREMEAVGLTAVPDKATTDKMQGYARKFDRNISCFIGKEYMTEAEVRDKGREFLMSRDIRADVIWLLDLADEFYTTRQIENIIKFVDKNSLIPWFRVSFKNYVFNEKTYLSQPFQPPRVWYTHYGDKKLMACNYDNDFLYRDTKDKVVPDKDLPSLTIPINMAWVKHLSWISNQRSKNKVAYQALHFKHGAGCSFAWDEEKSILVWNQEYFNKLNQVIPETLVEPV